MSLSDQNLNELLSIAQNAAKKASEIIASYQSSQVIIQRKDCGESDASQVLTEVDLRAEKAITELLQPCIEEFKFGLLTEESQDNHSRFNCDYFWCVDPLDGTLAFSKNIPGYSTSIALVSKSGRPVIGVVSNPRNGDLYHAIKDKGAYKNDLIFKVESTMASKTPVQILENKSSNDIPQGAVLNALATIESAPAFYYKRPKTNQGGGSLWDFAATSLIHSEAGGFNCDYFQRDFNFNSEELFMNHCGIIYVSDKSLLSKIPKL